MPDPEIISTNFSASYSNKKMFPYLSTNLVKVQIYSLKNSLKQNQFSNGFKIVQVLSSLIVTVIKTN